MPSVPVKCNIAEFRIKNGHSDNFDSGDWENIRRKKEITYYNIITLKVNHFIIVHLAILHFTGTEGNYIDIYINN